MKKIFTLTLALLMLTVLAVAVSAEDTANWAVGNGYNVVDFEKIEVSKNSPVTAKENADGTISVTHGGYYQDGKNWGGIVSKNVFAPDGLKITVKFDKVPKVNAGDDCWVYIGLLTEPQMFQVGDVPGNKGFMNLVRFSNGRYELYDGVEKFTTVETSDEDDMFRIKTGDVVTVSFAKTDSGTYTVKFQNGAKYYSPIYELKLDEIFANGNGRVAVSASLIGSDKDAFAYTVKVDGQSAGNPADLSKYENNDPEPGVVKVYVNGTRVEFDQPPVIIEGRTLVPVRAIVEALGAKVGWDDATKTVSASKGDSNVQLVIGSKQIKINGSVTGTLDVPAQIINSRTLVPARAISTAFGCKVEWVDKTKTVVITG